MNRSTTVVAVHVLAAAVSWPAAPHAASGPATLTPAWDPGLVHFVHEGHAGATKASGVLSAVDPGAKKVTLSHGVIRSLGWPAMTTSFAVGDSVDLSAVRAGMRVNFTLVRGENGKWLVDTIKSQ